MNSTDYYIILYTVLVGLTLLLYIKKWGELIQVRRHTLYVTVPILWSCIFVLLFLEAYQYQMYTNVTPSFLWGAIGTSACYYWIGMLLFPSIEGLDPKNQFTYFDCYEHFRKQIPWMMGLALLTISWQFWLFWTTEIPHLGLFTSLSFFLSSQFNWLIIGVLSIAFFSEHKGLMCLLAWIVLSVLIFV
jgi:hypothetical protein